MVEASTSKVLVEDGESRHIVKGGDHVLLKLPSTTIKPFKVPGNAPSTKIGLGKYGSFQSKELIGCVFGDTYEIMPDGKLEPVRVTLNEIEETEATNENIPSIGAQKLTAAEVEALKKQGTAGRDIIAKQIEEHGAFELKTEYSKDKYLKRKQAKFLPIFTVIEPTAHNVAEYYLDKDPERIRDLRPDTLAQMLNAANVRPGARTLVVESAHGLVVAAALERMAGDGRLMLLKDIEGPPDILITEHFNFPKAYFDPLVSVGWHATEPDFEPVAATASDVAPMLPDPSGSKAQQRKSSKANKRKAVADKVMRERDDYLAGEFDGCIITTDYEPYSVIERVLPQLAGSACVVVHSQHFQVLQDLHVQLKKDANFLAPSITEPWLRKYQVLPGRTHPEMAGLAHGGWLLTATRIFDEGGHVSAVANARSNKKRKREMLAAAAAAATTTSEAVESTDKTPPETAST